MLPVKKVQKNAREKRLPRYINVGYEDAEQLLSQ